MKQGKSKKEKRRMFLITFLIISLSAFLVKSVFSDWIQIMNNNKQIHSLTMQKKQLLDEHSKLDHEIFELENSKLKMPELTELKKLEEEAIRLQVLKDNPVYSNKERAAYMEQLNKTRKQIVTKKRELASRLNPIEDKIEKYKKRMYNIEKELNMNR